MTIYVGYESETGASVQMAYTHIIEKAVSYFICFVYTLYSFDIHFFVSTSD